MSLTHWGRVTHICISNLTIIGSDNLNQCWVFGCWTLRNKLQWNFYRNSNIFIQENGLECVVCEMAAILSRPQCVNWSLPTATYMPQWIVSAWIVSAFVQITAWLLMLLFGQSHYLNQCWLIVNWDLRAKFSEILIKIQNFHSRKCIWNQRLWNGGYFVEGEMS